MPPWFSESKDAMAIHITGIGWVTAGGMGCAREQKAFAMTDGPLPVVAVDAAHPASRRMDAFSKLGMAAIAFALKDAGLAAETDRRKIGIIAATEYGCLGTDLDYFDTVLATGGQGASPGLFSYTLPSVFLGEAAIRFGLTGPTFIVNEDNRQQPTCVKTAMGCIAGGDAPQMLCGICHPEGLPAFSKIRPGPSGALFFLIEKSPAGRFSYGELNLTPAGHLLFNGNRSNDLADLVQQCLAVFS